MEEFPDNLNNATLRMATRVGYSHLQEVDFPPPPPSDLAWSLDSLAAWSLNSLADLYRDKGQIEMAEPLFQRALAIREKAHLPDHPDLAWSFNGLGGLYRIQGQHGKAEPLFQRALAIRQKSRGKEHPHVGLKGMRLPPSSLTTARRFSLWKPLKERLPTSEPSRI
jgi:tetratricopeptide (TPR) repeat protein